MSFCPRLSTCAILNNLSLFCFIRVHWLTNPHHRDRRNRNAPSLPLSGHSYPRSFRLLCPPTHFPIPLLFLTTPLLAVTSPSSPPTVSRVRVRKTSPTALVPHKLPLNRGLSVNYKARTLGSPSHQVLRIQSPLPKHRGSRGAVDSMSQRRSSLSAYPRFRVSLYVSYCSHVFIRPLFTPFDSQIPTPSLICQRSVRKRHTHSSYKSFTSVQ